jgi:hypothetical protein
MVADERGLGEVERGRRLAGRRAARTQDRPGRQRVEPAREAALPAVAVDPPADDHQDLLHGVLDVGRAAQQAARVPHQHRPRPRADGVQRGGVAARGPHDLRGLQRSPLDHVDPGAVLVLGQPRVDEAVERRQRRHRRGPLGEERVALAVPDGEDHHFQMVAHAR